MGFIDLESQPIIQPVPGMKLRTPHGQNLMLSLVELEAGAEVPLHSHPHEQGGIVLEGKLELTIGGETRTLEVGSMYIIPGNVRHRAVAVGGPAKVLDVFSPIREDYAAGQSQLQAD